MAVVRQNETASITIQIGLGTSEEGKQIFKNVICSNIYPKCSDDVLFEFSSKVASLLSGPPNGYTLKTSSGLLRSWS